jgi:hypothetical protein
MMAMAELGYYLVTFAAAFFAGWYFGLFIRSG